MEFTATQIANVLQGEIIGDENIIVSTLAKIEEGKKGAISFLSNAKYTNFIYTTKASIVIVNTDFVAEKPITATLIKVADAYQAFTQLLSYYDQAKLEKFGIDKMSVISESASIGKQPYIGAFSFIGDNVNIGDNVKIFPQVYIGDNVSIGNNVVLYAGTKIYADCVIGDNVIMHAGVIIGSDGFGFAPAGEEYNKVPQIGNVIIGKDVEIGASTTIDRATLGSTVLGDGVKLDNLIQIAHNVTIGNNTVIAALTGIAGSTKIGSNCIIGGQVGIAGHLSIGNNVKIQAQSGIGKRLKDGAVVQGSPAFSYTDWNRSYVYFKNFPKTIRNIENQLTDLKKSKHE